MQPVEAIVNIKDVNIALRKYRELCAIKAEIETEILQYRQTVQSYMDQTSQSKLELEGYKVLRSATPVKDNTVYDVHKMIADLGASTVAAVMKVDSSSMRKLMSEEERASFAIGGIKETPGTPFIRLTEA